MADPAKMADERLADLIEIVALARAGNECDAVVSNDDVRFLAGLPGGVRESALKKLAAEGCSVRELRRRLKPYEQRGSFRVVGEGESEDWRTKLRPNDKGEPVALLDNATIILRHVYANRLSYNAMSLQPYLDGTPMGDLELTRLRAEIGIGYCATFQKQDLRDAVCMVAREVKEFHPVEDHLRALVWDEKPRLWQAARVHLGLTDAYSGKVLGRTFIAAVARGLLRQWSPKGCMVKTITILAGHQDAKKSSFLRVFGGEWFLDSRFDFEDRKGAITLAAYWMVELAEVDGMLRSKTVESTKQWTGQVSDTWIPIYGASPVEQPRGWIALGTTNKKRILADPTGSTRFHILDLFPHGEGWAIDVAKAREERDQILAEAVAELDAFVADRAAGVADDENPHRWWMNREENRERAKRNQAHQVESGWAGVLAAWLAGGDVQCPICRGTGGRGNDCALCAGTGRVSRQGDLPRDAAGREYVTVERLQAEVLGIPVERWIKTKGDVADALSGLGWRQGEAAHARDGKGRPTQRRVAPWYDEGPAATAEDLQAAGTTTAEAARRLEAVEAERGALVEAIERAAIQAEPAREAEGTAEPWGVTEGA